MIPKGSFFLGFQKYINLPILLFRLQIVCTEEIVVRSTTAADEFPHLSLDMTEFQSNFDSDTDEMYYMPFLPYTSSSS